MQMHSKDFHYENRFEETIVSEPSPPSYPVESEKKEEMPEKFEEFYNTYVQDKYKISRGDFISIFQIKDKELLIKELKDNHKVSKVEGRKLIKLFNEHVSSKTLF
jgi:uncharacterized protein YbcV (DUF1398 family)